MPDTMEAQVRTPDAYGLARRALESMEAHRVWPTPLNYELWLHMLAEPDGPLAQEIRRALETGEGLSDHLSASTTRSGTRATNCSASSTASPAPLRRRRPATKASAAPWPAPSGNSTRRPTPRR